MRTLTFFYALLLLIISSCIFEYSLAGLLSEPVQSHDQPNTVPSFPVQTQAQFCKLDLSAELFGGVAEACGRNLDRSRCCPVLAAWLFAAHARYALQIPPPPSSASPPSSPSEETLPMVPDDSQKCVNSLQTALVEKNVHLPQPNASCDTALCFCGIRLHQIGSLSCPAAFNVTHSGSFRNATPTTAVKGLEKSCRNSSYSGCTKCLGALEKLKGGHRNGTRDPGDRVNKMFDKDCQLMGLTWLLARNKTAYIPTVSAVLRALMYSTYPAHESKCSPDQENMPLAVDSLQFEKTQASSSPSINLSPVSTLIILLCFFG